MQLNALLQNQKYFNLYKKFYTEKESSFTMKIKVFFKIIKFKKYDILSE